MMIRSGMTLIELVVVLVVLTILAGVAGMALSRGESPPRDDRAAKLYAARVSALRLGRPVMIRWSDTGGPAAAIAMPDGSVIADSSLRVDRFSGAPIQKDGHR